MISAKWVPISMTTKKKASGIDICHHLLSLHEHEGKEIIHSIATANETWAYHYDREMKHQSVQCHYKALSVRGGKTCQTSAGKFMTLEHRWSVIYMDFLECRPHCNTENVEREINN